MGARTLLSTGNSETIYGMGFLDLDPCPRINPDGSLDIGRGPAIGHHTPN